jgi:hypothetical protein
MLGYFRKAGIYTEVIFKYLIKKNKYLIEYQALVKWQKFVGFLPSIR